MNHQFVQYRDIAEAECDAEHRAWSISDELREKYRVGADGVATGIPTASELALEATAWENVLAIRKTRYALLRTAVASDSQLTSADL